MGRPFAKSNGGHRDSGTAATVNLYMIAPRGCRSRLRVRGLSYSLPRRSGLCYTRSVVSVGCSRRIVVSRDTRVAPAAQLACDVAYVRFGLFG